jgi:hypothetical protein
MDSKVIEQEVFMWLEVFFWPSFFNNRFLDDNGAMGLMVDYRELANERC